AAEGNPPRLLQGPCRPVPARTSSSQIREDPARQRLGKPRHPGDLLARRLPDPPQGSEAPQKERLALGPHPGDVPQVAPKRAGRTELAGVAGREAVRLVADTW